jgi:ABC-type multidrug transport system fused ATPase/permease subunit
MLDTLEIEPEITDSPEAAPVTDPRGEIVFDHVHFRYTPDGPDVIRDLSFRVAPGQKLALVGPSGSGKTTALSLVMRYYDPTRGQVLIDGVDLRTVQSRSYRDHVALVLQENFIFSGTIRNNILFGNARATSDQVDDAVALSGLADLVRDLPAGLDTVLTEGGNLSGGQKQRVALARAVIRDPRFLYFDEATSALDPQTERAILAHLARIEEGRTRIVVAHNIASIRDADQILVLDRGRMVQCGTHEALLAEPGPYQRMWNAEEAKREGTDQGGPTA